MKSKIKVVLVLVLMITLVLPQSAFAKSQGNNGNGNSNVSENNNGNGNDKNNGNNENNGNGNNNNGNNGVGNGTQHAPGQLKKIEGYTNIAREKIRVNNGNVNFDVPPVIKNGRTLIPVRAVTEALGCEVEWVEPKAYIVSPDEELIIVFDLAATESGVYVAEGWTLEALMALEDDAEEWADMAVEIDVPPGLINNRTFVPLRFIAETLGLEVGYDDATGMIDICNKPVLDPEKYVVEDEEDLPDEIAVEIELNGFEFTSIEGLEAGVDYTTSSVLTVTTCSEDGATCTTSSTMTVTLAGVYIDTLEKETTKLEFTFEKDSMEVTKVFKIVLEYIDELPDLDPASDEIDLKDEELEVEVDIELNGWSFKDIMYSNAVLSEDNYDVNDDGDKVEFEESFLEELGVGHHTFTFVFESDDDEISVEFVLEVKE